MKDVIENIKKVGMDVIQESVLSLKERGNASLHYTEFLKKIKELKAIVDLGRDFNEN